MDTEALGPNSTLPPTGIKTGLWIHRRSKSNSQVPSKKKIKQPRSLADPWLQPTGIHADLLLLPLLLSTRSACGTGLRPAGAEGRRRSVGGWGRQNAGGERRRRRRQRVWRGDEVTHEWAIVAAGSRALRRVGDEESGDADAVWACGTRQSRVFCWSRAVGCWAFYSIPQAYSPSSNSPYPLAR